jgi:hypothetical protein
MPVPPAANHSDNACAGHSDEDRRDLWDAAVRLVHARSLAMRATGWLSQHVLNAAGGLDGIGHRAFGMAWDRVEAKVEEGVEKVLWKAHDLATIRIGPRGAAFGERDSWAWLSRLMASASGAVSGFIGLPGLLIDIPLTTTLMLRSIAEIARDHGEDIATDDGKRACLEVLAQGGPRTEDDDAELGYWSARAGLSHLTIDALIRTVASRFGVNLSGKLLAQVVPIAGAMAGGGLNWIFMGYYQEMARVHFTIRAIERRTGDPAGVRVCFDRLVARAREMKVSGGDAAGPGE